MGAKLYEIISHSLVEVDGVWEVNDSCRIDTVRIDPDWPDERILKETARVVSECDDEERLEELIAGWEVDKNSDRYVVVLRSPAGAPSYSLNLAGWED